MSLPLLPHRTMLANLRKTDTLVLIEHKDGCDKGIIVDLVFDASDSGDDRISLHDAERSYRHIVLWSEVVRIWTPTWTPTPSLANYKPVPVSDEPAGWDHVCGHGCHICEARKLRDRLAAKRATELKELRDRVRAQRAARNFELCESSTSFSRCADGELCWVPAHKEAARKLADFARSQRNL